MTMKINSIVSIAAMFFMIFMMQFSMAATPPKSNATTTLPISSIIEKINAKGYKIIREVEYSNNVYKAEVLNKDGLKLNLVIDEKTGVIKEPTEKSVHISILDAINKVEAAGYKDVYKIKCEDKKYEIGALNKDGKKVDLKVNAKTGEVSKEWF